MKKVLLTTMGIAALGMASYAATFMRVKTADGSIVRYAVGDVIEVDFEDEYVIPSDTVPVSNHPYVDLGLPSGTLWATYNVGATKPEEYGDYFAWGETEPKEVYDWNTYKYATPSDYDDLYFTKYNMCGEHGIIDNLSVLLPEDDAATANWGKEWRMPTNEEQRELQKNSYMVWTDGYNGTDVKGVIFYKAKSTGDKGKYAYCSEMLSADYNVSSDAHVFLPVAGTRQGDEFYLVGRHGRYWSSSLHGVNCYYSPDAGGLYFEDSQVEWNYFNDRYYGHAVRAVRAK